MTEYKCPYCGQDSYAKTSKKSGKFLNWSAVIKHTSVCAKNDKKYVIFDDFGPIETTYLQNTTLKDIKFKYPGISLGNKKIKRDASLNHFSKDYIISSIKKFYSTHNRIPETRDWQRASINNPEFSTVFKYFGSWNAAIEAAGFEPNIQNGYGINSKALDGHLYRSSAEVYFVNNYLYNKYEYIIEPKYPKPYNKWYDWYIKELKLYIELDGGCRPKVMLEKIEINKILNRKCLFINVNKMYTDTSYVNTLLQGKICQSYNN